MATFGMNTKSMRLVLLIAMSLFLAGCKDNPGKWPIEKIEAKLVEEFELVEVSSTPEDGGFTAKGKTAAGETFTIKVKQFPEQSKYTYDASSDRGVIQDGSYELK